jgi:hypothetical protein
MLRLKCDRAMPACGNCVNRGEITACCYAARKVDSRNKPQEASSLSDTAQRRIDHLEQLVLTLLKNGQQGQRSINTDSSIDVPINHDTTSEKTFGENPDQEHRVDGEPHSTADERLLPDFVMAMEDITGKNQPTSVDEAHWASMLNEVRDIASLYSWY